MGVVYAVKTAWNYPARPGSGRFGFQVRRDLAKFSINLLGVRSGWLLDGGAATVLKRLPTQQQYNDLLYLLDKLSRQIKEPFSLIVPTLESIIANEERGIAAVNFRNLADQHLASLKDTFYDDRARLLDLTAIRAFENSTLES